MINKILNSKEKKQINNIIKKQFFDSEDYFNKFMSFFERFVLLESPKGRIYIVNKEVFDLELSNLRIDNLGLYFGTTEKDGLRLTIEGSQLLGKYADKNIFNINDEIIPLWLKGKEFSYSKLDGLNINFENFRGNYIIIKYKNDFVGCGKINQDRLINFVPKSRWINAEWN